MRSIVQKTKSDVSLADFKIIKVLGQGTFGKVFLVEKNEPQARHFAMKAIRKEFVMENAQYDHIMNERKILASLHSPFLVDMHYAFQTEDKLYFVMDYVAGGELFTYLKISKLAGTCFTEK